MSQENHCYIYIIHDYNEKQMKMRPEHDDNLFTCTPQPPSRITLEREPVPQEASLTLSCKQPVRIIPQAQGIQIPADAQGAPGSIWPRPIPDERTTRRLNGSGEFHLIFQSSQHRGVYVNATLRRHLARVHDITLFAQEGSDVLGRVRTGRSALMGVPVIDLIALE